MEILRNYLEQIKQLWGGLSRSAKLATALMVVVIAGSLVMLIRYAAKPEMVAVFSMPLGEAETGHAHTVLVNRGLKPVVQDGKLLVRAEDRYEAYSLLAYENILPADAASAFEDLASKESMWRTGAENDYIHKQVKQAVLSRLIKRFPNVRDAQVILEPGSPARLGSPAVRPTASVHITMDRGDGMTRRQITAVADLVAGSVPGMARPDVRIVADGRSFRANEDSDAGTDRLDTLSAIESYFDKRISDHLRHIPGVIVTTHAVPDPLQSETVRSTLYDPDKVVTVPTETVSESSTGTSATPGGEPGTAANGAVSIDLYAGGSSSQESLQEKLQNFVSQEARQSLISGGVIKEISASVNVPRSYLVSVFKQQSGSDAEPLAADLEQFMPPILDGIKKQVMNAIGVKDDALVVVDTYYNSLPEVVAAPAIAGVNGMLVNYGKPAALAGLAFMAMLMVMMLVRRRHPSAPAAEAVNPLGGLLDATIGEVGGEDGVLAGMELDEDTIRAQKVVENVATMVKKNPDSAANLVRRWLQKK